MVSTHNLFRSWGSFSNVGFWLIFVYKSFNLAYKNAKIMWEHQNLIYFWLMKVKISILKKKLVKLAKKWFFREIKNSFLAISWTYNALENIAYKNRTKGLMKNVSRYKLLRNREQPACPWYGTQSHRSVVARTAGVSTPDHLGDAGGRGHACLIETAKIT